MAFLVPLRYNLWFRRPPNNLDIGNRGCSDGKLLRIATDLHPKHLMTHLSFALKNGRKSGLGG